MPRSDREAFGLDLKKKKKSLSLERETAGAIPADGSAEV